MECWIPLLDVFLNSRSPEGEASQWMQQNPFMAEAFLRQLVSKEVFFFFSSSSSSNPHIDRCMWIETLPNAIQSKILSFLNTEHLKFDNRDLQMLSTNVLKNSNLDFWVMKSALNLLTTVSNQNHSTTDSEIENEFSTLPDWLQIMNPDKASTILPWLPLPPQILNSKNEPKATVNQIIDQITVAVDDSEINECELEVESPIVAMDVELDSSIRTRAMALKDQLLNHSMDFASMADEIKRLCEFGHPLTVLSLIEPWQADEDTGLYLLNHVLDVEEDGYNCVSYVGDLLSSFLLPRLLMLNKPASRLLMSTTLKYAKLHKGPAGEAILIPLIMRNGGVNVYIGKVLSRIVVECLHPVHVSALWQELMTEEDVGKMIFRECGFLRDILSEKLVWTDPLFDFFHCVLNLNIYLSQDTIDRMVLLLGDEVMSFCKSLKFGNMFLCLLGKCSMQLERHKDLLLEIAHRTDTFLSKSIVSKIRSL